MLLNPTYPAVLITTLIYGVWYTLNMMKEFIGIDGKKYPLVRRVIHEQMPEKLKEIVMMRVPRSKEYYMQKMCQSQGSRIGYYRSRSANVVNRERDEKKRKALWEMMFTDNNNYCIEFIEHKKYGDWEGGEFDQYGVYNWFQTGKYYSNFKMSSNDLLKYGIDVNDFTREKVLKARGGNAWENYLHEESKKK